MKHRVIRDRFKEIFKREDGRRFYGELGDPNAVPRPRRELQNLPHRSLVTSRKAGVSSGILISWRGIRYLLAEQHVLTDTQHFLAVQVNKELPWTRSGTVIDPVAQVPAGTTKTTLNPALPVVLEPQRMLEEEGFSEAQYRAFTHAPVQKGDFLGPYRVMNTSELLGLTVVEMT